MLTPMQKDALTEILNMHLGASAASLSEMVNQKIILSVPIVELKQNFMLNELEWAKDQVITFVTFGESFNGNAFVMFPKDKATALVNACLGEEPDMQNVGFSNEDADVIKEIGNIILNSLVGEFGNLLDVKLQYSNFDMSFSSDALDNAKLIPQNYLVLVLYTSFFLTQSQVKGVILIALSADSFDMLLHKIDEMLVDYNA